MSKGSNVLTLTLRTFDRSQFVNVRVNNVYIASSITVYRLYRLQLFRFAVLIISYYFNIFVFRLNVFFYFTVKKILCVRLSFYVSTCLVNLDCLLQFHHTMNILTDLKSTNTTFVVHNGRSAQLKPCRVVIVGYFTQFYAAPTLVYNCLTTKIKEIENNLQENDR